MYLYSFGLTNLCELFSCALNVGNAKVMFLLLLVDWLLVILMLLVLLLLTVLVELFMWLESWLRLWCLSNLC